MTAITRTIAQAAQDTGLSQDTIREAINKGELPAKRYGGSQGKGGRILVRVEDLHKWVDDMEDVA